MTSLFRWLLRAFVALIALAAAALSVAYQVATRSIPDYDAEFSLTGIDGPVEIVRDHANVPHIFAASDADAFFGLGFVHAQDRLWQMLMMRRTAQGRLSEVFGERTLTVDEYMRRLDLYPLSVSSVAALKPQTQAALKAYSAGVNAWLAQVNTRALGRGAPEHFVFANPVAPWQPADSVAVGKLMAARLTSKVADEVTRARVSFLLPPERVRDIIPDAPGPGVAELPEYAALFPDARRQAALAPDPVENGPFAPRGLAGASNAWAAAPSRSATGATLLANDPHLPLTAPAIWYLARLELSSGGVIGGTIPGLPSVLVGRSENLAWGLTVASADDQDVFIERLNPDDPDQVLTPDGYRPMAARDSIINVKDAPPRTIRLQWTDNGPVLPGKFSALAAVTPPGHVAALGWTALSGADTTLDFGLDLMAATTIDEAIAAGARAIAPALNLVVASRDRIAMKTIGALPGRSAEHLSFGRLPAQGWRAENAWSGRLPYASNPEFRDPVGGIIGNTNNKILDRPFPLHVSFDWGDTQRIQRWRFLMQNREVHTRESFIEAQLDTVSVTARSLLPLVAADLWFTGEAAPEGTPERLRQRALALLADWNGEMNEHLPEPLIYSAWMRALQDRLIRDELGPLAHEFTRVEPVFIERVYRDTDGASVWCDVIQSAPQETCTEIARQSLDDALVWITENFSGELESLRWGDAHQAAQNHEVLGQVPLLGWMFNIRQSTSGGDNTLMRGLTSGRDPEPFLNVHAGSFRGVYDLADPDSSVFIISTGQSGHFLSRHYDDLGELWRRGEYIPMSLSPDLARAAAVGITHLVPAGAD